MQKLSIKELIKRSTQKKRIDKEQQDLKKALELSKIEHLNEQKKRLEQYSTLSQQQTHWPTVKKRKRIIEKDEDDEDEEDDKDWFQTISNRPQQIQLSKQRNNKVKRELESEKNQVLVEIDDVTTFLTKQEPVEEQSFDLTSLLHEEEEEEEIHHISDSESECSVIDLVDEPTYVQEEEDDGYLSPLEGFTSLNDIANQDRESFNAYHNQFKTTNNKKTTTKKSTKSTTAKKRSYFKKRYWAKNKKK